MSTRSKSSGIRNYYFEEKNKSKYNENDLEKSCKELDISGAYDISEYVSYIVNNDNKIKAFSLLYPIYSGYTLDKKDKSVKFLIMKIICASKQKNGYGGELLRNIEKNAKDKGFEYLIIDEPLENALSFYVDKNNYEYVEVGTVDGCKMFNVCWKKL